MTAAPTEDPYEAYCRGKRSRQLEPRTREGWQQAVDFWRQQRDRGNEFRDLAAQKMGVAGQPGWQPEAYSPTRLGKRFHDIGRTVRGRLSEGYEFKVGGGNTELTLQQLRKDEQLIRASGAKMTWVCLDRGQLGAQVGRRLEQLERRYPGQFSSVDLSDPTSVEAFSRQRPGQAQAFTAAATEFRTREATRGDGTSASAMAASFPASPTQATRPEHPGRGTRPTVSVAAPKKSSSVQRT